MRWLLAIVCFSFATLSYANAAPTLNGAFIDKVLVVKSERKLHLISRGVSMKSYRVSLGKQAGPKQQAPATLGWHLLGWLRACGAACQSQGDR